LIFLITHTISRQEVTAKLIFRNSHHSAESET